MLFHSLSFGLFFAAVLAVAPALRPRAQNLFLLLASYLFYAAWDWRFLSLLWLSTGIDFAVGLGLGRARGARARKRLLVVSLVSQLGILAVFKYAGFFAESLAALLSPLGLELPPFALRVVLPVGISFYTFQTLSYTIDVYRGRMAPVSSLLDFALFVAFFPQLVAGPIERATHLLPQVRAPRRIRAAELGSGAWLALWGLFKKAVVADNLAPLVDAVYAPGAAPTGPEVLLATYAFAFQIYCDFSGYTDIARGVARCLGFELMRNFDLPYLAASPREFWRRWHISLSTWLRDYLYIPLGGSRGSAARTQRNLALTMLLGGLWHGAAWTFVLWGAWHGALICAQRALAPMLARAPRDARASRAWRALGVLLTFHLVCAGWLLFRAESLAHAGALAAALASAPAAGLAGSWLLPLLALLLPLALIEGAQAKSGDPEVVLRWPLPLRTLVYAGVFAGLVLLGEDFGEPFLYFQF
jgi:D-alanyl-lipoteichoic acid acyltransferase DltB (MBOAT superfamily)